MEQLKEYRIISMVGREIAGYHSNLQRGFDQLGVDNYFFYERTHPFYKHKKKRHLPEVFITTLNDIIFSQKKIKRLVLFIILYPFVLVMKVILFPFFIKKYDVFIFSGNYTYLGFHIDRFILKALNKITIDIALGSDARPPYLNGNYLDHPVSKVKMLTAAKKKIINRKVKFTTHVIDHPTISQFNSKSYIPFLHMGFPFFFSEVGIAVNTSEKPLILHAPSKPKVKGTSIIRKVIDDLRNEGTLDFEYKELVGVPHVEVLAQLQKCSFIINELYSDTLMSGLDTEAAWFGKPSIVGGYNLDMIEKTVDKNNCPPTHRIQPSEEELKQAVICLLTDKAYRQKLGNDAQSFVKKKWSSQCVAQKYLDLISGNIPNDVYRSPYKDFDIYGSGINNDDRVSMIKKLTDKYGIKALCLNDKDALRAKIEEEIEA